MRLEEVLVCCYFLEWKWYFCFDVRISAVKLKGRSSSVDKCKTWGIWLLCTRQIRVDFVKHWKCIFLAMKIRRVSQILHEIPMSNYAFGSYNRREITALALVFLLQLNEKFRHNLWKFRWKFNLTSCLFWKLWPLQLIRDLTRRCFLSSTNLGLKITDITMERVNCLGLPLLWFCILLVFKAHS